MKNPYVVFFTAIGSLTIAIVIIFKLLDVSAFKDAVRQAGNEPLGVCFALGAFMLAFFLRAIAWKKILPSISFNQSLAGIHLSLGANHILPFRLGEPFRIISIIRRSTVSLDAATASTLTLRSADVLCVIAIGVAIAPAAFANLLGWIGWILIGIVGIICLFSLNWLKKIVEKNDSVKLPGPIAVSLSAAAWLLESILVWQCAQWAGLNASWSDALLVTTVAVAAQIAAIAPGGFGTYEAAAVAAYVALGYEADAALVAALTAHALKTSYSLVAGGIAVFSPKPNLLGRIRLQKISEMDPEGPPAKNAVLLFLPAFNEEGSVADCIRRIPDDVWCRPVEGLISDDGSTDRTAEIAHASGAEVIS